MNPTMTMQRSAAEITFDKFPLWQGVRDRPGGQHFYPFRLKMAERGFIQQQSDPEVEKKIVEAYKDPGYTFPTTRPGSSSWGNWRGERYHSFVKKHVPMLKGKSVMEIGAGNLYMAERFTSEDEVARYLVVDPSVSATSDDSRIRVIPSYFDAQFNPGDEQPDLILSINCLEHVLDPFGFLVKAKQLLRSQESRIALVFPDIETQFRMGDINVLCFEHINYFSEASANRLIRQAGLEIVTLEKGLDTLLYVLRKGVEPMKNTSYLEEETGSDLFEVAAVKFKNGLRSIIETVKKAQREGKKVAFHGACNGMNALFATGEISSENVLLFDGDELKAGKYIPSCPVPVLEATSPRYREADLVIVTAMTFYKEIRSFLESHHGIPADRILPYCSL